MNQLLTRIGLLPSGYGSADLKGDVVAGLTTAVMLIPQAMAYALLAGLPPIVGLYASVVPLVAYALVGSSRELAVGPVAMDSLLTAATVSVIATSGSERYVETAALLALMVGGIQVFLGLIRGGFLVNFLSRPVISGFTSAAALIIAASQLRTLLGLELPRSTSVFAVAKAVAERITDVHSPTVLVALASVAVLLAMKRWTPRAPRALVVVVLGAAVTATGGLGSKGVAIVGSVPAGLPSLSWPTTVVADMRALLPGALAIALVAFMEGISVATKLSTKTGNRVNANREFAALGLANVAAGLFGGYPVAGGLSRTAVNAEAGAKSQLAAVLTAATVAVTLAFFTGLLFYIPKASLGAIIVLAVIGLFDIKEPLRLWRVQRTDLAMLAAAFASTLLLGIQQGILIGVGLSLLTMIVRTTRPHTAVLGRLPDTEVYRNVLRFPEAIPSPGVIVVRLDAEFYFGNVNFLRDTLADLEAKTPDLRGVVLDMSGVNQIDSSAEAALRAILDDYQARGLRLILASTKGPVRDVFARSGFKEAAGPEGFTFRVHEAVQMLTESESDSEPPHRGPELNPPRSGSETMRSLR